VDLHTFFGVEAHFFVKSAAFTDVARPLDGLDEGGELDDLRAQRAVENPAGANGNVRSAALGTGEVDFHADIAGFDSCEFSDGAEEEHHADQNPSAEQQVLNRRKARSITTRTGVRHFRTAKDRFHSLLLQIARTATGAKTNNKRTTARPEYSDRSLGRFMSRKPQSIRA